jgi:hypothetical protein
VVGKVIHAVGTPFTGYNVQFKRNYNVEATNRQVQQFFLTTVGDQIVQDMKGDGKVSVDTEACDTLETKAKQVEAPGVSPAPLDPSAV